MISVLLLHQKVINNQVNKQEGEKVAFCMYVFLKQKSDIFYKYLFIYF